MRLDPSRQAVEPAAPVQVAVRRDQDIHPDLEPDLEPEPDLDLDLEAQGASAAARRAPEEAVEPEVLVGAWPDLAAAVVLRSVGAAALEDLEAPVEASEDLEVQRACPLADQGAARAQAVREVVVVPAGVQEDLGGPEGRASPPEDPGEEPGDRAAPPGDREGRAVLPGDLEGRVAVPLGALEGQAAVRGDVAARPTGVASRDLAEAQGACHLVARLRHLGSAAQLDNQAEVPAAAQDLRPGALQERVPPRWAAEVGHKVEAAHPRRCWLGTGFARHRYAGARTASSPR